MVTSNYVNSLNNRYRYSFTTLRGGYTGYNTAPLTYGTRGQEQAGHINSGGATYLGEIQSAAKSMQDSLKNVSQMSTFQKMQAVSSSKEHLVVSEASKPSESWSASNVSINQLATGQVNQSNAMKANDVYSGGVGYSQFEIEVDGQKHQVSVKVEGGDTNKTIQQKMATAINSRDLGITATVSTNSAQGTSTLSLRSKGTGDDEKNRFQIRDVSGKLVEKTGIDTITQDAQDARFVVDAGSERTSKTNEVDLGNGIKATLMKVTGDEPVELSKGRDTDYIMGQMKDMVKAFNSLYETGNSLSDSNPKLINDLAKAYNAYYKDLEAVGITLGSKGLQIDEKKLQASVEDDSLSKLMTDYGRGSTLYGFSGRLSAVATGLRYNTTAYMAENPLLTQTTTATNNNTSYNWLDNLSSQNVINKSNFNLQVYNNSMTLGYFMDMFI